MQTHEDSDAMRYAREDFLKRLKFRASDAIERKTSQITAGKEGEEPLARWASQNMHVTHLPDDEQGILRISVGGGSDIVNCDYCVIRGSVGQCIDLLERAIAALRNAP